jgi:ubiquitin-conjugating enzyme E2 D/E
MSAKGRATKAKTIAPKGNAKTIALAGIYRPLNGCYRICRLMSSPREKAIKRLTSEYAKLCKEPIARCTAEPKSQSDLFLWKALLEGPPDTPYADGKFNLEIIFPQDYPFKPPQIKMMTKCFHPNIRDTHICVDILQSAWSPALGITQILLSLSSLLSDPNPASPLNSEAAQLFVKNRKAYDTTVREWVQKHASGPKSAAASKTSSAAPALVLAAIHATAAGGVPARVASAASVSVARPLAPLAVPSIAPVPPVPAPSSSAGAKRVRSSLEPLPHFLFVC